MTANKTLATALVLIALSAPASIAEETPHRWYVGGSYGASRLRHGAEDFSDGLISDATIDDSDRGWKLFGGRRLARHLSIEAAYVELNNDVDGNTTLSAFSTSIDLDQPRAAFVALVGDLAVTDRAALLAKVGAASWKADLTTIDQLGSSTRAEAGTDFVLGIGFQYRVASRTAIRVEWERYLDVAGNDIDLGSLGVVFGLGG